RNLISAACVRSPFRRLETSSLICTSTTVLGPSSVTFATGAFPNTPTSRIISSFIQLLGLIASIVSKQILHPQESDVDQVEGTKNG
ncbi:Protein of unknown function, partial [Gryllus bimaculatus]